MSQNVVLKKNNYGDDVIKKLNIYNENIIIIIQEGNFY